MTTHDHLPPEALSERSEALGRDTRFDQSPGAADSMTVRDAAVAETAGATAVAGRTTGTALFADDDLAGLRARWDRVQAGFVDDPRDCVHKADGLVSDVVEQLTAGFTEARSRLEDHWSKGEAASTEDLRIALKQYREFFVRLLAV